MVNRHIRSSNLLNQKVRGVRHIDDRLTLLIVTVHQIDEWLSLQLPAKHFDRSAETNREFQGSPKVGLP